MDKPKQSRVGPQHYLNKLNLRERFYIFITLVSLFFLFSLLLVSCGNNDDEDKAKDLKDINAALPKGCSFHYIGWSYYYGKVSYVTCDGKKVTTTSNETQNGKSTEYNTIIKVE